MACGGQHADQHVGQHALGVAIRDGGGNKTKGSGVIVLRLSLLACGTRVINSFSADSSQAVLGICFADRVCVDLLSDPALAVRGRISVYTCGVRVGHPESHSQL
jgi:hypothetical protein